MTSQADRNRMAESLRQLASGRISNDQFEDALPELDRDTWPIFRAIWGCYDDLHEHRMLGVHRLSPSQRQAFARCCLFLRSGLSYEWPRSSRWTVVRAWLDSASDDQMPSTKGRRLLRWLCTYIPHNQDSQRRDAQVKSRMIDDRIWPFRRRADLNAALRSPPYLAGGSA